MESLLLPLLRGRLLLPKSHGRRAAGRSVNCNATRLACFLRRAAEKGGQKGLRIPGVVKKRGHTVKRARERGRARNVSGCRSLSDTAFCRI